MRPIAVHHFLPAELPERVRPGRFRLACIFGRMFEQDVQCCCPGIGILCRQQETVFAILDSVGNPVQIGSKDRRAA